MNRILQMIATFGFFFMLRQIISASDVAGAGASGGSGVSGHIGALVAQLGGARLTPRETSMVGGLIAAYGFVVGLVSHLVMGANGFGRGRNGLIALFGVFAALYAYSRLVAQGSADDALWMVVASLTVSLGLLFAAAALKAWIQAEAGDFLRGGETQTGRALTQARSAARSRGPSLDRIKGATSRRT